MQEGGSAKISAKCKWIALDRAGLVGKNPFVLVILAGFPARRQAGFRQFLAEQKVARKSVELPLSKVQTI